MKLSERQMSVGFGFAAGTFFGALAALVLLAALGIHKLKAEGPAQTRPTAVETSSPGVAPEGLSSPIALEADFARPAPAVRTRTKSSSPRAKQKPPHHSELDLQLD
jgi:hypothetical protein